MAFGILGTKIGMTRIFSDDGVSTPVTVIHAPSNSVVQVKSDETDGYRALQVSVGERKRATKAQTAHFRASGAPVGKVVREFRVDESEMRKLGDKICVDEFSVGQDVNVVGISKGKGFAGGIKRHNFSALDMSHGNSLAHRSLGSTGQCQEPGKVFKGKKMPGQLGDKRTTIKNLKIMQIDADNELLLISGAVPGSRGQTVMVKSQIAMPPRQEEAPEEPQEETQADEAQTQDAAPNAEASTEEQTEAKAEEQAPAADEVPADADAQAEAATDETTEATDDKDKEAK